MRRKWGLETPVVWTWKRTSPVDSAVSSHFTVSLPRDLEPSVIGKEDADLLWTTEGSLNSVSPMRSCFDRSSNCESRSSSASYTTQRRI